ncbi:MAG: transposase [Candidatus Omnitrophica bacterium]|nr:transposase [Candidatus Omnitrophota bacterium]
MSRPYRIELENGIYHVCSRGNRRGEIFEGDKDKSRMLDFLVKGKAKFKYYILGYVLMRNHYHFLIQTLKANISQVMHYVNSSYACYYNYVNKKQGHLFQGRYKGILVEQDIYLKKLTAYIHNNPVRAKMVLGAGDYRWSSYNGYMKKNGDGIIDKEIINQYVGMDAKGYQEFVIAELNGDKDIMKKIYAGCMLGSPRFIKRTLEDLKGKVESEEASFKKKLRAADIDIDDIGRMVAKSYGMDLEEIYSSSNMPVMARKVGMYLAKELTDGSNSIIGKKYGVGYSSVSKACKSLETEVSDKDKHIIKAIISHFKG